jgi:uncharacterized membrane protein YgcG
MEPQRQANKSRESDMTEFILMLIGASALLLGIQTYMNYQDKKRKASEKLLRDAIWAKHRAEMEERHQERIRRSELLPNRTTAVQPGPILSAHFDMEGAKRKKQDELARRRREQDDEERRRRDNNDSTFGSSYDSSASGFSYDGGGSSYDSSSSGSDWSGGGGDFSGGGSSGDW